jgi:hypothetical protein
MIRTWRSCPRKFEIEFLLHRRGGENVHLVAGGAFARGIEVARESFYIKGHSERDSLAMGLGALYTAYGDFEPPEGAAKTPERMAGALEYYFAQWPLSDQRYIPHQIGDKHGIEFSFAHPLPITHPVSGDPILFSGRADMVAPFGQAGLFLWDEKTTSRLGPTWGKQWDMRSQFTAYTWAAREWGLDVKGVIVRGISILKTKYEHAEAITYRPEWQVERWLAQTCRDIESAIQCWKSGYFDYNLDESCNGYSGCPYRTACLSRDPQGWLETQFQYNPWDPLKFALEGEA